VEQAEQETVARNGEGREGAREMRETRDEGESRESARAMSRPSWGAGDDSETRKEENKTRRQRDFENTYRGIVIMR
jgi:hypothetical protein